MRPAKRLYSAISRTGFAALLALAFAACTLPLPKPQPVVTTAYDFGPQPESARSNPAIKGTLLVPSVSAPSWLDEPGIVYRLLYEEKARPRVYAMSRWASSPAELMTERLRSRFAGVAQAVITPGYSAREDYTLRTELEDFSQTFEAPDRSTVTLRARATLVSGHNRALLAQREFRIERPAEPNAPGAVKALTEATDAFMEELVKWTAENARTKASDAVTQ